MYLITKSKNTNRKTESKNNNKNVIITDNNDVVIRVFTKRGEGDDRSTPVLGNSELTNRSCVPYLRGNEDKNVYLKIPARLIHKGLDIMFEKVFSMSHSTLNLSV